MVKQYLDRYMRDHDTEEWWTNKRVEASIKIDDLDSSVNAKVRKLPDGTYEIVFCAGLIDHLSRYAYHVSRTSLLTFAPNEVKIQDEAALQMAHMWVFMVWIDYIFHHEFAHIFCGHLELPTQCDGSTWNEFGMQPPQGDLNAPHVRQVLEAQADRFAAANIWGQITRHYKSVSRDIYSDESPKQFIEDYVYSILFMYKFLDRISAGQLSNSHPPAFHRAFIFQIFFRDTYDKLPENEKPDLCGVDIHAFVRTIYIRFFAFEGGMNLATFESKLEEAQTFFKMVSPTLRGLGLNTI